MKTVEFLDSYLGMKQIDNRKLSMLLKTQILYLLNSDSPDMVVEEITYLEGFGFTQTEPEKEFTGLLKGYWEKHYYSSRFMGQNLLNSWKMDVERSKKFESMALAESKPYSKNGFLPNGNNPQELMSFCSTVARKFVDAYIEKSNSGKLTGERIIFKKHDGANYYLTLAYHSEDDKDVLSRIEFCKKDFPFLF
jgi:hypothetical protein